MGIAPNGLKLLIDLRKESIFDNLSSILQLGKQDIYNTSSCCDLLNRELGIHSNNNLNDVSLFKALGFSRVESLDKSNFEGCSISHDLNEPIPQSLYGQFDALYDGGTLEHVFDTKQSLINVDKLLKVGGIAIHALPSNNHVDHGFYQFSPTLLYDWYTVNNYEILKSLFIQYEKEHANKPWVAYNYKPGVLENISFGGLDAKMYGLWFVVKKNRYQDTYVIPQQGHYIRMKSWRENVAIRVS